MDVIVEFHKPTSIDEAGGRKELAARCEAAVRAGLTRALSGSKIELRPARDDALIEALNEAETEEAA